MRRLSWPKREHYVAPPPGRLFLCPQCASAFDVKPLLQKHYHVEHIAPPNDRRLSRYLKAQRAKLR
jgi:hypothetical protein